MPTRRDRPRRSDSAPPGNDWPALRLDALPPVEPFPVDVLPDPAARLVIEGADAIGCPRDFLGVPMLAVAAGTIGRSVSLLMKDGYFASATVFAGCIGPPSDGKTPALKAVAGAVRAIDDKLAAEHAQAMEQWKRSRKLGPDGKKREAAAAAQAPPDRHRRRDDGSLAHHPGGQPAGTGHDPR